MNAYTKRNWAAGMFSGKLLHDGILDQLRKMFADVDVVGPGAKAWTPEQEMQCAVLLDAIDTIRSTSAKMAHQQALDVKWMQSPHSDGPTSFIAICESLGLEPEAVRTRVLSEIGKIPSTRGRVTKKPCQCCGKLTFRGYCKPVYDTAVRMFHVRPSAENIQAAIDYRVNVLFARRAQRRAA